MTLHRHNIDFIQIRDSVYDFTLALTLLVGLGFNSLLLKTALSSYVTLKDSAWKHFTYLWITFFFFSGLANEYIRHHVNITHWVDYKISMIIITLVFTFVALHLTLIENKKA
jgi:intracellular septation protein